MNYKIIGKHNKDCHALKNAQDSFWNTPWAYFDDQQSYYGDSLGRHKNGHKRWLVAICNNTECHAKIIVREDSMLEKLPNQ